MKYFIFLVFAKALLSQNTAYEKFQKYVQSPNGCVLWIEYSQSYFDDAVVSSGVFYAKEKMYMYDNKTQCIIYEDGFITTINKLNKQVVYDFINKKDVTIFDVLIGNDNSIRIDSSIIENNQIHIPFSIELWGIKGSIWTSQVDGSPKKVTFIQDEEIKVHIDIKSSANKGEYNPLTYDISDYEVINLIE